MSSQDITLSLYPVISSHGDLVSASFKHVNNSNKKDNISFTTENLFLYLFVIYLFFSLSVIKDKFMRFLLELYTSALSKHLC